MAQYFIHYALREADEDELLSALDTLNAKQIMEALWCVHDDTTSCSELRDELLEFIGNDDGLIVIEANDWSSYASLHSPNH